jgi:hypothetical protein
MKRCPQCKRGYTDETLNFCLDDGAALLDGPSLLDGPPTAIISVHETEGPTKTYDAPKREEQSVGDARVREGTASRPTGSIHSRLLTTERPSLSAAVAILLTPSWSRMSDNNASLCISI